MIERFKTGALIVLVALSLVQSYMLAYSVPTLGATVKTEQEYELTETMGETARIDQVIFPEDIVLHLGEERHSLVYPGSGFFDRIYSRIKASEFSGFQRVPSVRNWSELRRSGTGVELRFGEGIPVQLLQRVMRMDGDLLFLSDSINRILIVKQQDRIDLEIYFFSSDGTTVYEPLRANVSLTDLEDFVGLGVYLTPYYLWRGGIYLPSTPIEAVEYRFSYSAYSPEQMQRNLFFDSEKTRYLEGRNGSQIYTDGKRGLQLESGETWMVYTDPVAPPDNPNNLTNNALAALQFVNHHGGWDGMHRFIAPKREADARTIRFQQYFGHYPLIGATFRYGHIKMVLQQGVVSEYERSLLTRGPRTEESMLRWLPGEEQLRMALENYSRVREIEAVFPAQFVSLTAEGELYMEPVWAARLENGTLQSVMRALPVGTVVTMPDEQEDEAADSPDIADGGEQEAGAAAEPLVPKAPTLGNGEPQTSGEDSDSNSDSVSDSVSDVDADAGAANATEEPNASEP
jgi:regulatory protein YycH of two-component signal transduction system YycFG